MCSSELCIVTRGTIKNICNLCLTRINKSHTQIFHSKIDSGYEVPALVFYSDGLGMCA